MTIYKKIILLSFLLVFAFNKVSADDVIFDPDTTFGVGNQNYTIESGTVPFSQVIINDSWVCFNGTGFNITSSNPINISLVEIHENYNNAIEEEVVLDFYAETTAGNVTLAISGLKANQQYRVLRNHHVMGYLVANSSGCIKFNNSVWSKNRFRIIHQSTAPGSGGWGSKWIAQIKILYGTTPLAGALVRVYQNEQMVDSKITNTGGIVNFELGVGHYNIICEHENETIEEPIEITENTDYSFSFVESEPPPDEPKKQDDFNLEIFALVVVAIVVLLLFSKKV